MTNLFKALERIEEAREGLAGQSFMAGHSWEDLTSHCCCHRRNHRNKKLPEENTVLFFKGDYVFFGEMGYETADSKGFRGEPAFGIEQLVQNAEMFRIGEGSTDVR